MRERTLRSLARISTRHPRLVLVLTLLSALMALWPISQLEVSASRFDLIASNHEEGERAARVRRRYGAGADLVVAVTARSPRAGREAVERLAAELRELDGVRSVTSRIQTSRLGARQLLFLDSATLRLLRSAPRDTTVATVFEWASRRLTNDTPVETLDDLERAGEAGWDEPTAALRQLRGIARELVRWLDDPTAEVVQLGGPSVLPVDEAGFLVSRDGRTRFLFVAPSNPTDRYQQAAPLTRAARLAGRRVEEQLSGVSVGFTGYPVIAVDEVEAIRDGSVWTGALALFLVLGLFAFRFRSPSACIVAFVPLTVGILWAFAFMSVTIGSLNLLTQIAVPVYAGLGIDFAIHWLSSYHRARGRLPYSGAVMYAVEEAGKGILTAGVTTALAFLSLLSSDYPAFRELGLSAGVGLLLVMGAVLWVTPALIGTLERFGATVSARSERVVSAPLERVGRRIAAGSERRPWVLGLAVALSALAVPGALRLGFDPNVEGLMPPDAPSLRVAEEMRASSVFSNEHLIIEAPDVASLRRLSEALRGQPRVGRVESLVDIIPPHQPEALSVLADAPAARSPSSSALPLDAALARYVAAVAAVTPELRGSGAAAWADELSRVASEVELVQRRLSEPGATARLEAFEEAWSDRVDELQRYLAAPPSRPLGIEDLPAGLRTRFVHRGEGEMRYALYVYPASDVFEGDSLRAFNDAVRAVAPHAVGAPVAFASFVERTAASAERSASITLAVVALVLLIDFRRPRDAIVAMLPVILGGLWTVGLLGWLGVSANFANVAALPLIFGIGVDDGVHLVHRGRDAQNPARAVRSVLGALVLTSATTIVGFGCIGFAPHRGMQSFALAMAIGAGACLVATLLVVPAFLPQARSESSSTRPAAGSH